MKASRKQRRAVRTEQLVTQQARHVQRRRLSNALLQRAARRRRRALDEVDEREQLIFQVPAKLRHDGYLELDLRPALQLDEMSDAAAELTEKIVRWQLLGMLDLDDEAVLSRLDLVTLPDDGRLKIRLADPFVRALDAHGNALGDSGWSREQPFGPDGLQVQAALHWHGAALDELDIEHKSQLLGETPQPGIFVSLTLACPFPYPIAAGEQPLLFSGRLIAQAEVVDE